MKIKHIIWFGKSRLVTGKIELYSMVFSFSGYILFNGEDIDIENLELSIDINDYLDETIILNIREFYNIIIEKLTNDHKDEIYEQWLNEQKDSHTEFLEDEISGN